MTEPTEKDASDQGQVEDIRIGRGDIFSSEPRKTANSWDFALRARAPGGEVEWGLAHVEILPDGSPKDIGPSMIITKKELTLNGKTINLKTDFSITSAAIAEIEKRFKESFGTDLKALSGSLAMSNLSNFQREWYSARRAMPSSKKSDWNLAAIKAISFGKARIKEGYTEFEVEIGEMVTVDLGDPHGIQLVPSSASVVARKGTPRGRR